MTGQCLDVLGDPVTVEFLDGIDDTRMHDFTPLMQQAGIGRLAHQRVMEDIGRLRRVNRLEEARRLQTRTDVRRGRRPRDTFKQPQCRRLPDHRGGLQHILLRRGKSVDALGQTGCGRIPAG